MREHNICYALFMLSFVDLSYLVTVIKSVSIIHKGEFPGLFRKVLITMN